MSEKIDRRNIIEFQKFVCQNLSDQIKQADTKAAAIISVLGITTAGLLSRLTTLKSDGLLTQTDMLLYGFAAIVIIVGFKFAISVIFPRVTKGKNNGLIYFGDIILTKKESFIKNFASLNETRVSLEYADQARALSLIAERKYWNLRQAFAISTFALIFTIITLIISN